MEHIERDARSFLHVDDLCLFLMRNWESDLHINVGTGEDCSIRELAEMVRDVVHPDARLIFDTSKPDGAPRKLLDVSRLHALGWRHSTELRAGIEATYRWYVEHKGEARRRVASACRETLERR